MKVVILCGGRGTRLREETEYRPKPMVPIGDRPILWHIMKIYASYGYRDFVLCLGYKGEVIKQFFRDYQWMTSDVTFRLGSDPAVRFHGRHDEEQWSVTLVDTGLTALTAGRIKQIREHIGTDAEFLLTYGDGVGNVDIAKSIEFHRRHGKTLTVTAVHPPARFGELALSSEGQVLNFEEKPQVSGGLISGGFFVASANLFRYLDGTGDVMFEQGPMQHLAAEGQLMAHVHEGFWQPMDTYQEYTLLNHLWSQGQPPWKTW